MLREYSIAHHELGHALAFYSGYPRFAAAETAGGFRDAALVDYYGAPIPVNRTVNHFSGVVDPASLRGIFGNE